MQKNKIILVLSIGLLLSPFMSVKAEVTAPTVDTTSATTQPIIKKGSPEEKAKIAELKAKLMEKTELLRKDLEVQKKEIEKGIADQKGIVKKKLEVKVQEKVRVTLEKIYNKLNDQSGKLSQVDMKIAAKIAVFEKEGKNMTAVKAQYAIAKEMLNKTTAEVLATRMIAVGQVTTETSKETLRDLVKKAEESIRATGAEYRKILPLLAKVEGDNSIKN